MPFVLKPDNKRVLRAVTKLNNEWQTARDLQEIHAVLFGCVQLGLADMCKKRDTRPHPYRAKPTQLLKADPELRCALRYHFRKKQL